MLPTDAPKDRIYPISEHQAAEVTKRFTYHSPQPDQLPRYAKLRGHAREFALMVLQFTPVGREQALALTKLEEAVMHAQLSDRERAIRARCKTQALHVLTRRLHAHEHGRRRAPVHGEGLPVWAVRRHREVDRGEHVNRPRPTVICLCGSSRFIAETAIFAWELEKRGAIVLAMHFLPQSYLGVAPDHQAEAEGIAAAMDELHLRKIDLADKVIVVNPGGYFGESTRREIMYAEDRGVPVSYLEDLKPDVGAVVETVPPKAPRLVATEITIEEALRIVRELVREIKAWRWLHWGASADGWACACGSAHGSAITEPCPSCNTPRPTKGVPTTSGLPWWAC